MAKRMEKCVEVAPPAVVFPVRPSQCPKLETIREEAAEEGKDDFPVVDFNFAWFYQILSQIREGFSEKVVVGQGVRIF
ncbi:hypothetical protein ACS0TY_014635 [Phlomoides rotata]